MIIYVVFKAAKDQVGEQVMVSTEKAFKTKENAQQFVKNFPVVWEENINGVVFYCERAIHEIELED